MGGSREGLVSHLVVGLGVLVSDALPFWSPSLLLYRGRDVGDLRSVVADEEAAAGFDVDDRSSIVTRCRCASVAPYPEGNRGNENV